MGGPGDRKALAVELFEVTGEAVPETDPIVTGALFFSHKLGEAGRLATEEIREAARVGASELREAGRVAAQELGEAGRKAALDAGAAALKAEACALSSANVIERMVAERSQFLKALESQMFKCVKIAANGQSSHQGIRYVPAWYALVGAVLGAFALAAAWAVGVEHGATRAEEAAVGRSFARVVPTLDPKLKAQLMEHLRKNPG